METILQPFTYCCEREVSPNQRICLNVSYLGGSLIMCVFDILYNKIRAKLTRTLLILSVFNARSAFLVYEPPLVEEDSVLSTAIGGEYIHEKMVVVANNAVFDGFHIGVADDDYLSSIETAI